jgi:hypothetical protein
MKVLKEGQYSGKITSTISVNGLLASITAYNEDSFNSTIITMKMHFQFCPAGRVCVKKERRL